MHNKRHKQLLVVQASLWAAAMITAAIVNVVLENNDGLFTFFNVCLAGTFVLLGFAAIAQLHLRWSLRSAGESPLHVDSNV